jgi:Ca2+/H+ antiporter
MLIAGAVTSIIDIINKVELLAGLERLLLVLVIFYIIGLIAKVIIHKATSLKTKTEEEEELEEESDNPEGNTDLPQDNTKSSEDKRK